MIYKWSVRAVEAAEQTIPGRKKGYEKKEAVKDFIKKLVDEKDLGLTDAQIENLIESAVYALKQGGSHDERTKSIH